MKFLDKVKITCGFYKGHYGWLIDKKESLFDICYLVLLDINKPFNKEVWIPSTSLEKVNEDSNRLS